MKASSTEHLIRQSERLIEEGELDAARDLLEGVLASSPKNVNALNNAALVSIDLGDPAKGAEYFEKALDIDPSHEASFYNLLDFAIEEREFDLAKEIYESHKEHIPPSKEKATYQKHLFPRSSGGQARAQSDLEEALETSARALGRDPRDADAAHDAGLAAWELGHLVDAIDYFERALEAQPGHASAFYSLIDLLIDQESNELAVETFLRYHEEVPDDEEKAKYSDALVTWAEQQSNGGASGDGAAGRAEVSPNNSFPTPGSEDKLKIAIVCGPDRKFITDIEHGLREKGHAVHPCYLDEKIDLQRIQRAMDWADVTWFEWCDKILVQASQKLRRTSKVVCRLHSYEVFTTMPALVQWDFVDRLVFVAPHIEEIFYRSVDAEVAFRVIPNGVDLNTFSFRDREPSFELAYVGYINHKKNPALLLQCMSELVRQNDRYVLHVAGEFQELRYQLYFEKMIPALGLDDNVVFHGWVDDLDSWLDDKSHLISTSVLESFGMSIAEAMAKGIKPLIHNWVGAEEVYPEHLLFNTPAEFVDLVTEMGYDSFSYRQHIAENYSLDSQLDNTDALLNDFTDWQNQADQRDSNTPHEVRLPGPVNLSVPQGDHISAPLMRGRFYEQPMLDFIHENWGSGFTAVDIGAHIGNHTTYLGKICEAKRVDSFEPNPYSYTLLESNVKENNLSNVHVHPCAIGSKHGSAHLEQGPSHNSGMSRIVTGRQGHTTLRRLDDVIQWPVDLIKIDVEGMAGDVIDGALRVLRESHPALFIECGDAEEYANVASRINALGYVPCLRFNHTPTILFKHQPTDIRPSLTYEQACQLRVRRAFSSVARS